MNKILILVGCPASGKSTYAKQLCIDDSTYKRINKDDIRIELFENNYKYSKENENLVLETERQRGISFIDSGFNIIVDDTNCHMKHIEYWSNIAKYKGLKLEIKQFDTTLEECIERDKNRETKVGEEIVRIIHNQYLKIKKQLKSYIFDDRVPYILNRDNKERCIILDMDGTMSLAFGRSAYNYEECANDTPNTPLLNVIKNYDSKVIIITGRPEEARDITIQFLNKHKIRYDELYCRQDKDMRHDNIIKKEIYEKYIKDRFVIDGVFEDRDRLVDMYRKELNLPCYQVYYGNF